MYTIQNIHIGKVRNSLIVSNGIEKYRIVKATNRISAFDFVFPFTVAQKGKILQGLSAYFFTQTSHIVPNCFVGILDPQTLLFKEAQVIKFEFIVRRFLCGSLWRLYKSEGPKGVFDAYGIALEPNLNEWADLKTPIITPTTKEENAHDLPVSHEQVEHALGSKMWEKIKDYCLDLFKFGFECALKKDLVLVDTKYEFGIYKNEILLVDEVHTPDSSRYVYKNCETNLVNPQNINPLSKEFLREKIIDVFGKPENIQKHPAHHEFFCSFENCQELSAQVSDKYRLMFSFFMSADDYKDLIEKNSVPWPISENIVNEVFEESLLPEKILIVGDGGRDVTLAHAFASLCEVHTVFCAPPVRQWEHPKFKFYSWTNVDEIAQIAKQHEVGLVVCGPEAPISQGLRLACEKVGIPVCAPDLAGASLETSKILCKQLLCDADVPTARAQIYTYEQLVQNVPNIKFPYVIKYDSIANGKGVFVIQNKDDLSHALKQIKELIPVWNFLREKVKAKTYSTEHNTPCFLVEECINGHELSVMALCSGNEFKLLPIAKDYKRRNDFQTGPNTGGMGSICPLTVSSIILEQIKFAFQKTLDKCVQLGTPYYGFLFAGFMIDAQNKVWVLEFNCRLGDPETQVILPGLKRSFFVELYRTSRKKCFLFKDSLNDIFDHDEKFRAFVVGAAPEYPEASAPERTLVVPPVLPENVAFIPSGINKNYRTNAGRAFGVRATHETLEGALNDVYQVLNQFYFLDDNGHVVRPHARMDIGT